MRRADFLKRAGLLLLAPTAARAIDFGALVAPARIGHFNTMTITPGTGAYFASGDLVRNELTGEVMRVIRASSDTLTIARG